jgi:hypothetical protein
VVDHVHVNVYVHQNPSDDVIGLDELFVRIRGWLVAMKKRKAYGYDE